MLYYKDENGNELKKKEISILCENIIDVETINKILRDKRNINAFKECEISYYEKSKGLIKSPNVRNINENKTVSSEYKRKLLAHILKIESDKVKAGFNHLFDLGYVYVFKFY
ncbi:MULTISPECIES: hypothetical protein [Vibrio]|uniref:hypothetical protein n=1 Tax=Vibrio TaxID=662 RepID=UPI002075D9AB|nr:MULTISPECIES: hypothetical protein [Vibrio]USD32047.1 hypothetical protein J8Z27_12430 [Vibrio sp. SCSIO 43186]USD45088.1 hypothetical protein J4N38_12820 [Vibrio sp. SCSIO 43145]USD69170.1 hypothetical protein J4N41_12430 [Vibrio sp. SCSIO 43139]USD96862.1 hypothetical protein CTT30_12595 [Vibrio coralliilyticus]